MRLRALCLPVVSLFLFFSSIEAVPVTDNEIESSTLPSFFLNEFSEEKPESTNDGSHFMAVAKRDTVVSAGDAPKIVPKNEFEGKGADHIPIVPYSQLKKRQVGDKLAEKDKNMSLDGSRTRREKTKDAGHIAEKEENKVEGSGQGALDTEEVRRSERRQIEGIVIGSKPVRARRDTEEEALLGDEKPVESVESVATLQAVGRPGPDDRHRPRPDLTCASVSCVTGTQCVIENGRPACKPDRSEPTCETIDCRDGMQCIMDNRGRPTCIPSEPEPQQRTCRDVNCPRDSRCRMERDPRCRGRDCTEQPVCVREAGASCRNVQCPSGTRCTVQEEPGCRGWRCREVATCVDPCDGLRCPVGSLCRFDGRDAMCTPVALNPCLTARCPNGFECRNVQNQAQCFAISTPAPTPAPTTPSPCFGMNEEFASCATFCEPNCVEKNPACILACAAPRCQCSNGFYRNQQGVCVPAEQCEFIPSCGPNETFVQCSTPCEPKCGQPVALACPAICGPSKCQCKQGFWRHPATNQCVQQNQCFFG